MQLNEGDDDNEDQELEQGKEEVQEEQVNEEPEEQKANDRPRDSKPSKVRVSIAYANCYRST